MKTDTQPSNLTAIEVTNIEKYIRNAEKVLYSEFLYGLLNGEPVRPDYSEVAIRLSYFKNLGKTG